MKISMMVVALSALSLSCSAALWPNAFKNNKTTSEDFSIEQPVCRKLSAVKRRGCIRGQTLQSGILFGSTCGMCWQRTRSEGWVSYKTTNSNWLFMTIVPVSQRFRQCSAIGTRSEGWNIPGHGLQYANCANLGIECGAIGSRSEGWFSLKKSILHY